MNVKRRNSVSVEDGTGNPPTIETEGGSRKKPERLFLRSPSVGLAPGDGEQSPGGSAKSIDDKRQNRRESIKEQLMKFKAKAGKILEDVQKEKPLNDENSTSFISQNSENDTREELSIADEQAVSESSFQQGVSKKESKDQLRNRVRKSAQKAVERTRGNVQLNRRLARRPTIVVEEQIDENDIQAIDEQVEKVIRMGEKFLTYSKSNTNLDKDIEDFFAPPAMLITRKSDGNPTKKVFYGRVKKNEYDFENLVKYTVEDSNIIAGDIMNRIALRKVQIPPKKLVYTDSEQVYYGKAERTEEIITRLRRRKYVQLDVFIDSIHIDHHSIWSDEDVMCSKLRNEYFAQTLRVYEMAQIESHHEEIPEFEKNRLLDRIRQGRQNLERCWRDLGVIRDRQGYVSTKLIYHPTEVENYDDWMKFGKVEENGQITQFGKLPKDEKIRKTLADKTYLQLILFFNEMEVSKTSWIPLGSFLIPVLRRFELELYSPAQSLNIVIVEKQGSKVRMLGKAKVPLPNEKDAEIALHEAEFECSDDVLQIGNSYGASQSYRERGRILCRAILEGGQLKIADDRKSSKIDSDRSETHSFEPIPPELLLEKNVDQIDEDKKRLEELREEDLARKRYIYKSAIDSKRLASIEFANMSRKRVMDRRQKMEKKYEELVREEAIPTLSVAFSHLFAPADDSRRLKPMRREDRTPQSGSDDTLVINIQSAVNLPVRESGTLQPFVIINFAGKQVITDVAVGRHPNWQFTTKMTISKEDRESLDVEDCIEIRVYDQTVVELDRDDRIHNIVHEQLLSRLLASTKIRFETLAKVSKVNVPIKMHLPVYLSNYRISPEPCFLKILLSTKIKSNSNTDCRQTTQSFESPQTLEKVTELQTSLQDPFPKRIYRPLVLDMNAKSTLCSRFLRPINPPTCLMQENSSNTSQICKLAGRVVSMMPRVNATSHSDIWATVDQLTTIAVCGLEEKAVLLGCWLLYFKLPVVIVLGEANGERTGYVCTEIDEKQVLIDPEDGHVYPILDSNCVLEKISGAFDEKSYYANIQEHDQTPQIMLNFTKVSHWKPLTGHLDSGEVFESIQPAMVQYSQVSDDWILELRIALEREIKLRFDEARTHAIPQWNLVAARQLREILESPISPPTRTLENIVDDKISRIKEGYRVNVNIFKFPYVSIQDCIHEVLSSKLHETPDPNAQFAIAVHIVNYFAHVIRVDIAIAVLKPRK